jgi:hypothetical protein
MEKIKWDWYGTWVLDWLLYEKDDLSDAAWGAYEIWEKAYLAANPELAKAREQSYYELHCGKGECDAPGTSFDLIENHYGPAMNTVFDSWVFKIWQLLQWPTSKIRQAIWTVKRRFS